MSLTLGVRRRRAERAPEGSSRATDRDPWAELQRELDRSRRFERSMTLLRFRPRHDSHWHGGDYVAQTESRVRSVDRVWHGPEGLFLLLPETGVNGMAVVVGRVLEQLGSSRDVEVEGSTFPHDGITLGALISRMHLVDVSPLRIGSGAQATPAADQR